MPNIDEAIDALLAYQQSDMDGVMVLTSRQAIHEVADELKRLRAVPAQGMTMSGWKASEHTEGPNADGYYTAGIDTPQLGFNGRSDFHFSAIEFHSKDRAEAERRRDLVLQAVCHAERQDDSNAAAELVAALNDIEISAYNAAKYRIGKVIAMLNADGRSPAAAVAEGPNASRGYADEMPLTARAAKIIGDAAGSSQEDWSKYDHAMLDLAREADLTIADLRLLSPAANEIQESQAKEPEASGGLCADATPAVRVGEAGADRPATSEHMDVTAGETAPYRYALELAADTLEAVQKAYNCPDSPIINLTLERIQALAGRSQPGMGWQPIETAPREREPILLKLKDRIPRDCEDIRGFDGLMFVGRFHGGHSHWGFAAPVGMGGFPDNWFEGWLPLPSTDGERA